MVQISSNQVAAYCDATNTYIKSSGACSPEMDIQLLNHMVWIFRDFLEAAIIGEYNKLRNGTID